MFLGIDHLVIAVREPDIAIEALAEALAMQPGGGGEHPAWGTRNRLLWLGDSYIELLGVTDERLAAESWLGGPALAALATGPALIAWAIASDELERDAATLRAAGAALGTPISGERLRPDGSVVRWRLGLPPRLDLRRPFLIEHLPGTAEWTSSDRQARAGAPGRIRELELPIDRVDGLTVGAHDHALVIGSQRVVVTGRRGVPTVRLGGLGPPRSVELLGCVWAIA